MRGSLTLVGVAMLLAACGVPTARSADEPPRTQTEDDSAGMGVPQQFPADVFPGDRRPLRLQVHVAANGCFLGSLDETGEDTRYLVVWPAGTELGSRGDELRLPDGGVVHDGDELGADGLLMPTADLTGFGKDGFWDFAVGFCAPGANDVLVLDPPVTR
jgi:hypothetical protein